MPAKELDMKKWVNELRLSYHGTKYTCRRATYFIDKREAQRLSWSELSELYLHLYICPFCRRYKTADHPQGGRFPANDGHGGQAAVAKPH
jgi:hypothetical protein